MKEGGCRGPDMVKRASTERCLYGHCADFFLLICSLLRYLRPLFCGDGELLCPVVKLKKRGSSLSGALPLAVEGKVMRA